MSGTSKPAASPALAKAYQHLSNIVLGSSSESSSLWTTTNVTAVQHNKYERRSYSSSWTVMSGSRFNTFTLGSGSALGWLGVISIDDIPSCLFQGWALFEKCRFSGEGSQLSRQRLQNGKQDLFERRRPRHDTLIVWAFCDLGFCVGFEAYFSVYFRRIFARRLARIWWKAICTAAHTVFDPHGRRWWSVEWNAIIVNITANFNVFLVGIKILFLEIRRKGFWTDLLWTYNHHARQHSLKLGNADHGNGNWNEAYPVRGRPVSLLRRRLFIFTLHTFWIGNERSNSERKKRRQSPLRIRRVRE